MDSFNDLRSIWLTAKTDSLPSAAQMVRLVKGFRKKILVKKIFTIVTACLLIMLMAAVMLFYKSTFITTRIGEIITIVAAVILAYTNIRSIKRFYNLADCSNIEFLQFLEQTRQNQIYYYRNTQVVCLLLSSAGMLLYQYELTCENKILSIITYALAIVYLLVIWFVVRPRGFKKAAKQLNDTKQNLEKILKQLE